MKLFCLLNFQEYDEEEDEEEETRARKKKRKGALGFIIDEAGKSAINVNKNQLY